MRFPDEWFASQDVFFHARNGNITRNCRSSDSTRCLPESARKGVSNEDGSVEHMGFWKTGGSAAQRLKRDDPRMTYDNHIMWGCNVSGSFEISSLPLPRSRMWLHNPLQYKKPSPPGPPSLPFISSRSHSSNLSSCKPKIQYYT